jgi:hypothetical protein
LAIPFAARELTMDSAKLVANLRPGRHLADVGQQPLAKTVEPGGGKSVANGPLGLEARERGWSGAMSIGDRSPLRLSNDAWSRMFLPIPAPMLAHSLSFDFRPLSLVFRIVCFESSVLIS